MHIQKNLFHRIRKFLPDDVIESGEGRCFHAVQKIHIPDIITAESFVPKDDLLNLLQTLCSKKISKKKKLENLAIQGIDLEDEIEEGVNRMCNLSDAIETQGIQQGAQQREKEIALEMLKSGMSCDLVAKFTKISVDTLKEWMKEIPDL